MKAVIRFITEFIQCDRKELFIIKRSSKSKLKYIYIIYMTSLQCRGVIKSDRNSYCSDFYHLGYHEHNIKGWKQYFTPNI